MDVWRSGLKPDGATWKLQQNGFGVTVRFGRNRCAVEFLTDDVETAVNVDRAASQ